MSGKRSGTDILVRDSETLPPGWTMTTLGEVCALNPKLPVKPEPESPVTFVPMAAVCEYTGAIITPQTKPFAAVSKGYTPFIEGDVIWAKITPCMENGKAAIARNLINGVGVGSTEFFVLRSKGKILPEYLHRFIRQEKFRAAAQKTMNSAVGQARVPKDFLLSAPIPLPPLPEQRRIVARLEALEALSRRAREKLAAVPAQLAQARQSLLASAFQSAVNSDTANILPLESLTQPERTICYGVVQLGEETPGGVPCIRTSDIKPLALLTDSPKRIHESISANYSRTVLRGGEVLVSVRGTLGGIAVAPPSVRGWNISREVAMIALRDVALPQFIATMIAAPQSQSWLTSAVKGVAYSGINIADLKHLPVPLPPLAEQHEIVRRLNAAFARLDAAAAAHAAAVAELDRLDQSLLARAFSGGLVAPSASVQAQTYLLRFIPALLRAAGHPVSLDDLNRAVALRFLPESELLPVVERLGGAEARAHFATSTVTYEDGAFLAAMRLLRRSEAVTVATDRHGIQSISVGSKPPPGTASIDADALHLAPLLGRVPAKCVTPTLRRLQSVEVREALLATA